MRGGGEKRDGKENANQMESLEVAQVQPRQQKVQRD